MTYEEVETSYGLPEGIYEEVERKYDRAEGLYDRLEAGIHYKQAQNDGE